MIPEIIDSSLTLKAAKERHYNHKPWEQKYLDLLFRQIDENKR